MVDPIADVSTAVGARRDSAATRSVPALTIVSHPDARRAGERLVLDALAAGEAVEVSRNAPAFGTGPLADPFVSRHPIRFAPAAGGGVRVTADAGGTPIVVGAAGAAVTADELAAGVTIELAERVVLLLHACEPDAADGAAPLGMVGDSAAIRRVRAAIERVVDLSVPVLVRGETGTGKELVARALHAHGPGRAGPFLSVNLGALPRELAAAELFGAVRGAYTGAVRERLGLFRAAHGGTLFLDEVGEAPPEVQVMLLRALEAGEVVPVGADAPVPVQVRVVAATDANLEADGRFKAPLFYRLSGYEIRLPPLRQRREDIGALLWHFAREELAAIGEAERLAPEDPYAKPWLPAELVARLVRYAWPGNVRELRNVTRQLAIDCRGLSQARLPAHLAELFGGAAPSAPVAARRKGADVSDAELLDALRACAWDLKRAADVLRIPRPSIYDLIERSPHIRTAGDLTADEIAACHAACGGDLDAMAAQLQVSRRALARRVKELGLGR